MNVESDLSGFSFDDNERKWLQETGESVIYPRSEVEGWLAYICFRKSVARFEIRKHDDEQGEPGEKTMQLETALREYDAIERQLEKFRLEYEQHVATIDTRQEVDRGIEAIEDFLQG